MQKIRPMPYCQALTECAWLVKPGRRVGSHLSPPPLLLFSPRNQYRKEEEVFLGVTHTHAHSFFLTPLPLFASPFPLPFSLFFPFFLFGPLSLFPSWSVERIAALMKICNKIELARCPTPPQFYQNTFHKLFCLPNPCSNWTNILPIISRRKKLVAKPPKLPKKSCQYIFVCSVVSVWKATWKL